METLIHDDFQKKKKTELLDNFWTERMRRKLMTNICSPHSFTFCLKNVHTFVCVFKDWIITKTLKRFWKQKDFKLICTITVQQRGWRATHWHIVQIRYFYYLNFWIQKAILLSILSQWRRLISILTRCILSCCHTVSLSLSRALFKYENCTFSN